MNPVINIGHNNHPDYNNNCKLVNMNSTMMIALAPMSNPAENKNLDFGFISGNSITWSEDNL